MITEGFWSDWFRNHVHWFAWIFTVGAAIVGLILVREYTWIGVLLFVAAYTSLLVLAYEKHRDLLKEKEVTRAATQRADEADRRLTTIPANLLEGLHETIRSHSFEAAARVLGEYIGFIERMRRFSAASDKPVRVKTFSKRDGYLFAAPVKAEALKFLKQDDTLILEYKDDSGLVTRKAHLIVHQVEPDVWFRVEFLIGDDMKAFRGLAEKQAVAATGYTLKVDADLERYANANLNGVVELLDRVSSEIIQRQG